MKCRTPKAGRAQLLVAYTEMALEIVLTKKPFSPKQVGVGRTLEIVYPDSFDVPLFNDSVLV
jgi:hypothetical protein